MSPILHFFGEGTGVLDLVNKKNREQLRRAFFSPPNTLEKVAL